jgi:hypothetical protein
MFSIGCSKCKKAITLEDNELRNPCSCGPFKDLSKRDPEFATLLLKALMAARQSEWELFDPNDRVDPDARGAFYDAGGYTEASWCNGCPAFTVSQDKEEM